MSDDRNCTTCRYGAISCPVLPCDGCSEQVAVGESKWEPISKADWIRSLSDEELASYLAGLAFGWDAINVERNQFNRDVMLSILKERALRSELD